MPIKKSLPARRRPPLVSPVRPSVRPSVLSLAPSIDRSVDPSITRSVSPSITRSVSPSITRSVSPSVCGSRNVVGGWVAHGVGASVSRVDRVESIFRVKGWVGGWRGYRSIGVSFSIDPIRLVISPSMVWGTRFVMSCVSRSRIWSLLSASICAVKTSRRSI